MGTVDRTNEGSERPSSSALGSAAGGRPRLALVAADVAGFRRRLARFGVIEDGTTIAGQFRTTAEFLAARRKRCAPVLVLLELATEQPLNESEITRFREISGRYAVVLLADRAISASIPSYVAAGVGAVIAWADIAAVDLAAILRAVTQGAFHLSPMWARMIRAEIFDQVPVALRIRLTPGDVELLRCLAGHPNPGSVPVKTLADQLGKSSQTVRNRITNLGIKMGRNSRVALVEWWRINQHAIPV